MSLASSFSLVKSCSAAAPGPLGGSRRGCLGREVYVINGELRESVLVAVTSVRCFLAPLASSDSVFPAFLLTITLNGSLVWRGVPRHQFFLVGKFRIGRPVLASLVSDLNRASSRTSPRFRRAADCSSVWLKGKWELQPRSSVAESTAEHSSRICWLFNWVIGAFILESQALWNSRYPQYRNQYWCLKYPYS
ncbi:hypothetical protein TNIN_331531 [Trichonephila inaurata madagascariensis]|uniref:Uncharacterized protein n=1 Tax=Trichonephila inaurata madagascariensis TaxID=2747483 RepID=A0A8X6JAP1_9ARAC|nr:hypothetical protein TNIN_331531 [Trichonephila inaurata madagascariensis]